MVSKKKIIDIKKYLNQNTNDPDYFDKKNENLRDVCNYIMKNRSQNSFRTRLFGFIDEKGLNDVEVYKKADLTRNVFYCIKKGGNYQVSKKTALKCALSLELTIEQTELLLDSAGYSLNRSDPFDLIIMYHLENKIYDIFVINETLNELAGVIL